MKVEDLPEDVLKSGFIYIDTSGKIFREKRTGKIFNEIVVDNPVEVNISPDGTKIFVPSFRTACKELDIGAEKVMVCGVKERIDEIVKYISLKKL